jgi:type I restriction enzyme S subunit
MIEYATLPAGWRVAPLGSLADVSYGIVQPGRDVDGGVPIVRVRDLKRGRIDAGRPLRVRADIENAHARTRLAGGEVLLSLVGSVGQSAVVPDRLAGWNVARAVAVLRPTGDVPASWVNTGLASEPARHCIAAWLNTTVQATLNLADVKRLPIVLPPAPERESITAVLDALTAKIDADERLARTALELAEAEFAAAGRNGRPGVLNDVVDLVYGKALPSGRRRPGPVPVLGSAGPAGWHDEALAPGPGIVVGRKGTVGAVHWVGEDFYPIDTTFYVRRRTEVELEYLFFLLRSAGLDELDHGSAVPGLARCTALSVPIRLPDGAELERFGRRARPLVALWAGLLREADALTNLRSRLLPRLLSGRLRPTDVDV